MVEEANEELKKADEYLRKHRILELFSDLCASVCFHKPSDLRGFLLEELQLREREGAHAGNFEDAEIKAVFNLTDLMQMGVISEAQARKALLALANSHKQKEDVEAIELPPEVDEAIFLQKAKDALQFR
ncbi:EF-hand calcium-binding domain-containing protein 10 [Durusdinium trenchii]